MPIQLLLLISLLIAAVVTWRRAKEGVIRAREAILWTCVWIVAAVVILLPETTSIVANLLGVGRGVDLVLYASVVVLFFLLFKTFVSLDKLEKTLTDIVRKEALRDVENVQAEKKDE